MKPTDILVNHVPYFHWITRINVNIAEIGCVWLATPIPTPPSFSIHLWEPDGIWGYRRMVLYVDSWVQRGTKTRNNISPFWQPAPQDSVWTILENSAEEKSWSGCLQKACHELGARLTTSQEELRKGHFIIPVNNTARLWCGPEIGEEFSRIWQFRGCSSGSSGRKYGG